MWRPRGGTSRLTWRRLGVLVDQLPPESCTKTAQRDSLDPAEVARMAKGPWSGYGPWSREALMLAEVVDHLNRVIYTLIRVNGGKRPPPEPYPRPGVVPKTRHQQDPKAVAFLAEIRKRRRRSTAGPRDSPQQPAT